MVQFLSGEYVPSIAWLERKQTQKNLHRPGHFTRSVIAPIAASGVMFYHLSGLGLLYEYIEQFVAIKHLMSSDAATVVRFSDLDSVFSESTLLYCIGIFYASVVSVARKFHLLL